MVGGRIVSDASRGSSDRSTPLATFSAAISPPFSVLRDWTSLCQNLDSTFDSRPSPPRDPVREDDPLRATGGTLFLAITGSREHTIEQRDVNGTVVIGVAYSRSPPPSKSTINAAGSSTHAYVFYRKTARSLLVSSLIPPRHPIMAYLGDSLACTGVRLRIHREYTNFLVKCTQGSNDYLIMVDHETILQSKVQLHNSDSYMQTMVNNKSEDIGISIRESEELEGVVSDDELHQDWIEDEDRRLQRG
ncbi:hypothetical protein VNO77_03681 [Canavalia gladiata]|uniref:Uncharacterized protein n=1 Tax=Canavalia gladiata TaxID=3824 RepID=A0AAN9R728_CANGL